MLRSKRELGPTPHIEYDLEKMESKEAENKEQLAHIWKLLEEDTKDCYQSLPQRLALKTHINLTCRYMVRLLIGSNDPYAMTPHDFSILK